MRQFAEPVERFLEAQAANPKLFILPIIVLLLAMIAMRRFRCGAWPTAPECGALVSNSAGLYYGALIGMVLCFTNPPKFEYLSPNHQAMAGLFTVVLTAYYTIPRLYSLFAPDQPLSVPPDGEPVEETPVDRPDRILR